MGPSSISVLPLAQPTSLVQALPQPRKRVTSCNPVSINPFRLNHFRTLFATAQRSFPINSNLFMEFRTLSQNHRGGGCQKPKLRRNSAVQAQMSAPLRLREPAASHKVIAQRNDRMEVDTGGDTVSTEAVAARRHAGVHLAVTWWKLELPTTTWHLLLN
jgi:hypothetical protein